MALQRVIRLVPSEAAMEELGGQLAEYLHSKMVVYLRGELGAGKTTLVRGLLRHLGYRGPVRSPTYTLVESYEVAGRSIHHFDLYRLVDPEELEYAGGRDYFDDEALCLVEWPEHGSACLPPADLDVDIQYQGAGRCVTLVAGSEIGCELLGRGGIDVARKSTS